MNRRSAKIILICAILAMLMGYSNRGFAEVNVNIGIGVPLPSVVIPAPPSVVLIPATYVYFVPDISVDILFYHGHWYRPHHGHYYRATSYNGPWVSIAPARCPGRCYMSHRIFAASRLDTSVSRTESSTETGEPGKRRNTGTSKHTCSRQKR